MARALFRLIAIVLVMGLSISVLAAAEPDPVTAVRISPFSGKPVPRFEALRYAAARGRAGPDTDYPVVWRYERKGLPMLIIKETQNWRKVRDPDGDEVWMHARMLEPRDTILVQRQTPLYRTASETSEITAQLANGVIARSLSGHDGWIRVDASGHRGWIPADAAWGHAQRPEKGQLSG